MTDRVRPSASPARSLPTHPNLEHLRKEAKSRLKTLRETDPTAQLATAQREVARSYGFQSWRRLQAGVFQASAIRGTETPEQTSERLMLDQALPRKAVSIDPAILDRYVGYYELNPKTVIKVTREKDDLLSQLTGQMLLSLSPESETKFFFNNSLIKAQLSFLIEQDGKASAAVLHQNGREQISRRIDEMRAQVIEKLREERQNAKEPAVGSEDALRRMIAQTQHGLPNYGFMSDELAKAFREQLSDNRRLILSWGDLISIDFVGVSKAYDSDVYDVKFTSAATEWRLNMESSDKIGSLTFRIKP